MEPVLKPIGRIHYRKVIGRNIEQLIQKIITALAYGPIAAVSLFLFVLLTRIPFRSQILYHWDSINFAAAIQKFDLANESPHPPGYILYVWLIRGVNLIFNDAQTTMVNISIIASALAVVALYFLGKAMFGGKIGLIAALFLATSPIFWFYGEIALPHTLDTFLVIVSVWLLYLTMRGDLRYLYPAVIVVALAGGLRPQTLVFLLPLVLFSLRKAGIRKILSAAVLGGIVCLMWFIPLINASGGFSAYMRIMGEFSDRFQESTSIFMGAGMAGVQRNGSKVVFYTLYGLSLTILPMIIYGTWVFGKRIQKAGVEKLFFLAFWITPALFFYLAIHMGQQGLIFVYLPALILLASVSIVQIFRGKRVLLIASAGGILLFNVAFFTLMPEYPLGPGSQRMLTSDTLRNSDQYFRARIDAIEYNFEAGKTGIIARDWRYADYYLPDYTMIPIDPRRWDEFVTLKEQGYLTADDINSNVEGPVYVVLFDGGLDQRDGSSPGIMRTIDLGEGELLGYYELQPQDQLFLNLDPVEITLK
jgi:hypothetical protein